MRQSLATVSKRSGSFTIASPCEKMIAIMYVRRVNKRVTRLIRRET